MSFYQEKAKVYSELHEVSSKINDTLKILHELKARENGLNKRLNEMDRKEKPVKAPLRGPVTRVHPGRAIEVRRHITSLLRNIGKDYISASIIIAQITGEIDVSEEEIKTQLRYLRESSTSPVIHNGIRGRGSSYKFSDPVAINSPDKDSNNTPNTTE